MTDERQAQPIPGSRMGSFYPNDAIVALIDDGDTAAAAVAALREAGWGADDIRNESGEQVTLNASTYERERSLAKKVGAALPSEEREAERQYKEAAARGAWTLIVKADTDDRRGRARDILRAHRAYGMRHYGRRVITDL